MIELNAKWSLCLKKIIKVNTLKTLNFNFHKYTKSRSKISQKTL